MPSTITVTFEFPIGAIVYFKHALEWEGALPKRFMVHEQHAVTRSDGGVERLYRLVEWDALVPEIALSWTWPDYRPRSVQYTAEQCRVQQAIDKVRRDHPRAPAEHAIYVRFGEPPKEGKEA